jgi:uncharacterized protein (TIGR02145 family)
MRYLTTLLILSFVVLSSGCDPNGYSCNSEGCYAENNAQYLTLEDCLSVCDELNPKPGNCGAPVSHEGYDYSTVQIGEQCWFSENCRYLPEVSSPTSYSSTTAYYYVYEYIFTDVEEAKATANYETYGVLYNWPAVMTSGICPSGWHIPSDGEWQTMEISLGMSESEAADTEWRGTDEGYQMKSTSGWDNTPDGFSGNGSNSSGFNGLPGGYSYSGGFYTSGDNGYWWSASESGSGSWRRSLDYDDVTVYRSSSYRGFGFSARCVRD